METLKSNASKNFAQPGEEEILSKEEKIELFFAKKAAEAAIFMKNNPLPYELSKQAWDERKAKKKP